MACIVKVDQHVWIDLARMGACDDLTTSVLIDGKWIVIEDREMYHYVKNIWLKGNR